MFALFGYISAAVIFILGVFLFVLLFFIHFSNLLFFLIVVLTSHVCGRRLVFRDWEHVKELLFQFNWEDKKQLFMFHFLKKKQFFEPMMEN
jgi:hypothetical protein